MTRSKLTSELRARLAKAAGDTLVEVVLEIQSPAPAPADSGATRQSRIAAGRRQFADAAAPVESRIQELGGEVLDHTWLNHTLRARLPARTVDQLADTECVTRVDVPAQLARE